MTEKISINKLKDLLKDRFVITDENVFRSFLQIFPEKTVVLAAGEKAKSFDSVMLIMDKMLKNGLNRHSTVTAVGGGAIGDVTGFTASIFMRGINWEVVPSTVTAFVDSSIGGKTAINYHAKNTVGTFFKPSKIYHCFDLMTTLSKTEIINGMAEVFKTALLSKPLFERVNSLQFSDFLDIKNIKIQRIMSLCADIKTAITDADFLDNGIRRQLNLGHTLAHALEGGYGLRHGEGVILGLYGEAVLANVASKHILEWIRALNLYYFKDLRTFNFDAKILTSFAGFDKKNNQNICITAIKDIEEITYVYLTKKEFEEKLNSFLLQLKQG